MERPDSWIAQAGQGLPATRVGGKAAGLDRLVLLGLPVPPFVTLTVDAYRACCDGGRVPAAEDEALRDVLDEVWRHFGDRGPLAVRSSAVAEDDVKRSWAGQMETFLNVTTRRDLTDAVLGCWRSLHGERAAAYRYAGAAERPDSRDDDAMAVIVQRMLAPRASGVLFTIDPASSRPDRMMVSAVLGLGEGLVSGALDADTYVLDRNGSIVESTIVGKATRFVAEPTGGTLEEAVPATEADRPALEAAALRRLAACSVRAEAVAGVPLDIEFAVQDDTVYFLQARPVTATATAPAAGGGNRLIWDNSNIVESYPGITLPLTFSFIRRAYHAVYWQFCQLLGMRDKEIRANDHMLRNMLGLHRGRVYYNLRNWYRLVSILPGFPQNRRFMEGMMGVSRQGGDDTADRVSRSRGALALASTALRAIWLQATLGRRVARFHETFDRVHGEFSGLPYETMEPATILDAYRRVEQELLWRWQAPIVNDFSVMVFYGLLQRVTVRWGLDPNGNLHNVLVSKQGGIESADVSNRLEDLAAVAAADPDLRRSVLTNAAGDLFDLIRTHERAGPLLASYMERFGDRCVAELKLESRTMRDDPTPLMAALQASVRRIAAGQTHERHDARKEAEALVRSRLSPWRRVAFAMLLHMARNGVRNRENQRLARTRAFALVRRMMRNIGRGLADAGVIDDASDVFFLELDELMALCDGTATLTDPRALVAARRHEYVHFEKSPPLPDRFTTTGTTVVSERLQDDPPANDGSGPLRGLAAYPGLVERTAVVMLEADPHAGLAGEILVTRQTDPGWVILFPSIGGLIVERGSMLSHSAIVAREMGIPAVVGVRGATDAIRTGDRVRLDGAAGRVDILHRAQDAHTP